ncbi:hypothetical protein ColLi_12381 [Colletotrichum liriopes]|uniref:ubiquitinyl hydrolase 1 n=1 Tax=Colletotrichum liriopes TaxID=708192 RepID=A0AA37H0V5_9PEZI|nr:hypothetical protein ColLi_12381 [Colletotrichum liriopes]
MEYCVWVADSDDLPHKFHQLLSINLEDRLQCIEEVFPYLKYAKAVVDYFLEHIVFPKELKEFPHKLSASGWDLGEEKPQPTTGFSGTNDSRAFLPLTVSQLDDREQQPTNALVLEYLLQDENSVVLMRKPKTALQSDAEALLETVVQLKPPVRVILDVGAQILELDNLEVAKRWLQKTGDNEDTQAVIFCDENDQIYLKLPPTYRAAVTLGANLTKDRLVQACMRMRKLGKGQSVIFCVPEEIQQKIIPRLGNQNPSITVVDILEWAIAETFVDLRRGIRLWANQGQRHKRQQTLWAEARVNGSTQLDDHADKFLEEEAQTLDTRYRPDHHPTSNFASQPGVDAITDRLLQFGGLDPDSATFREEQERELSPEVEQERQIQRPPPADPAVHYLHSDIRRSVSQGVLSAGSKAYMPAFIALADTSAAQHFDVKGIPQGLLVTADFVRTIVPFRNGYISDLFQRSVQWILTSASETGGIQVAIIISPYEAHELLPELYVKSLGEYADICEFLSLTQGFNDAESDASNQTSCRDIEVANEALVQFMRVFMTKIRRNCESIDKTHVGRILDHRLLGPDDFE